MAVVRRVNAKTFAQAGTAAEALKLMEAKSSGPRAWQIKNFRPSKGRVQEREVADCIHSLQEFLRSPPENNFVWEQPICGADKIQIGFSSKLAMERLSSCKLDSFVMDFTFQVGKQGLSLGGIGPLGLKLQKAKVRLIPSRGQWMLSCRKIAQRNFFLVWWPKPVQSRSWMPVAKRKKHFAWLRPIRAADASVRAPMGSFAHVTTRWLHLKSTSVSSMTPSKRQLSMQCLIGRNPKLISPFSSPKQSPRASKSSRSKAIGFWMNVVGCVASAGNCQFEALVHAAQVPLSPSQLRFAVVQYLRPLGALFGDRMESCFAGRYQAYCDNLLKDGVWGDDLTLLASAHILRRPIVIITDSASDNYAREICPPQIIDKSCWGQNIFVTCNLDRHFDSTEEVLGGDPAARSHRVEQFTALWGL